MCCATCVYFPFSLEDNVVLRHSGAVPVLQPPCFALVVPWLHSAERGGGGGTGGVAQGVTLWASLFRGTGCSNEQLQAMHCVQLIKWKITASHSRVEATLEKMMVLFSLSMPAVRSFVRGTREWDVTGETREGLRSMNISREWQKKILYWRGCVRD